MQPVRLNNAAVRALPLSALAERLWTAAQNARDAIEAGDRVEASASIAILRAIAASGPLPIAARAAREARALAAALDGRNA